MYSSERHKKTNTYAQLHFLATWFPAKNHFEIQIQNTNTQLPIQTYKYKYTFGHLIPSYGWKDLLHLLLVHLSIRAVRYEWLR